MEPIRTLLADPQILFREGLKALLGASETVAVVGEVTRLEDAALSAEITSADLVLMDVSGRAARIVRSMRPQTRVAFLTNRIDAEAFAEYRESGAAGFILKDTSFPRLMDAIRTIHAGGAWVCESVAGRMAGYAFPRHGTLTPREHEVLKMTAEGHSVREVATILDLSAKTVDAHKVNLMRKLRIHNKAQLVHYAFQNQILKLPFEARV